MNSNNLNRRTFLRTLGGASVLTLAGLSVAGCYHESYAPPENDTDQPPSGSTPDHEIEMTAGGGEFIFSPDRLVIEPGETVRFVIESGSHSSTAYHPDNRSGGPLRILSGAEPWDSGVLSSSGATFDHTFDIEGAYNYFCSPHESLGMVGMIVVGSALDGPGMATPQDSLPDAVRTKLAELIEWARQQ